MDPNELLNERTQVSQSLPKEGSTSGTAVWSEAGQSAPRRKAGGPRTIEGKERSKFNALRDGLFSKCLLIKGESKAVYKSLLTGLMEDLGPQGTSEKLHVEALAVLYWHKRRLVQAENAEIAEKTEFLKVDSITRQKTEAWDCARSGEASGGMLRHFNNHYVVREAAETLELVRLNLEIFGFAKDSRLLRRLYGVDSDKGTPHGLFRVYEVFATLASLPARGEGDLKHRDEMKETMLALIDGEIERLMGLEKILLEIEDQRSKYRIAAAVVPCQEALERFLRIETHLNREIGRELSSLERLQRMRLGQQILPKLEVHHSRS